MVDRVIWKGQEVFPMCSCLYSWVGAKDVLDSDIKVGRQCFHLYFPRGFSSHGGYVNVIRVSVISESSTHRSKGHQMKMKMKMQMNLMKSRQNLRRLMKSV